MGTLVCEEKQQSEAEPNSEQLLSCNSAGTEIQDEEGSRHVDSGSTKEEEEEPKPKKKRLKTGSDSNSDDDCVTSETLCENETDAPQLHDCKEEEVLTVQQLCNQERNSSLDQEEQDAAQVKEEEEQLRSNAPTNKTFLGDHQYPTLEWKMDHPDAVSGPQWQKELGPLQNELVSIISIQ
ncbi:uncharacterized protein KZ484_012065 [Pholidichthys leucotaenia]